MYINKYKLLNKVIWLIIWHTICFIDNKLDDIV